MGEAAQARIDPQAKTPPLERIENRQRRRLTGDRIQIRDVEFVESEMFAKGRRNIDGISRFREPADNRLVFLPPARDAADHLAIHEVDDGEDLHVERITEDRGQKTGAATSVLCLLSSVF